MSRFLIALFCLSVLVMTQNRVVATSNPSDPFPDETSPPIATASIVGTDVPQPAAVLFLIVGLSGLTAAGSRSRRRSDRASV
jgi:hypothetical protein